MNERSNGPARARYPVDYEKIALAKGDPLTDFWLSGYVRGHRDWYFSAKVFDRGSEFGLYGGRVSKLEVYERDRLVMHYDRGWITRPPSEDHHSILNKIVAAFPEPTKEQYRDHRRAQRERFAEIDCRKDSAAAHRPTQPAADKTPAADQNPMGFFQKREKRERTAERTTPRRNKSSSIERDGGREM